MQHSIWFYVILYGVVFLLLSGVVGFRRWWYGVVAFISAVLLTAAPRVIEMGIWPIVLAALLFVGLQGAILWDHKMAVRR
jgi:hypothetical protein